MTSALLSGAAAAQTTGVETSTVEEIVVTAQKRSERLGDVPMAITALAGDDLERSSVRGVSEALRAAPGVAITENYLGSGTNIAIRGVTSSFPTITGSNAVAYYLDTVPFGLVRSAIAPDASAFDLERVEVLRGPQGTLYGSSALNGVVRILTRDADVDAFDAKARATVSSTSHGGVNYRADGALNIPVVPGKLGLRAVVGYQDDDGWVDQPNRKDVNDRQVRTFRLKLNAQPTEALSVALSSWFSRSDSGAPSFGVTFDQTSSVLDQPAITAYDAYGARITYEFPGFTASSMTSYLDYRNEGTLGLDVAPFGAPGSVFFNGLDSDVFSEEVLLSSEQSGSWRWSLGGIYRRGNERLHQYYTGLFSVVPEIRYLNTSESYAVFGELTRVFADGRLELTGGLRYFHDDESQRHQTGAGAPVNQAEATAETTTPRLVLKWKPTREVMAYASYSKGFRSGFPQPDAVLLTDPSFPPLRPDKLTNYEVGSKGALAGGLLAWDIALFYIDWTDIQQLITVPFAGGPGFPALVNGEGAKGPGVDLALTLRPREGLTFQGSVSWNGLEMESDIISAGQVLFRKGDRPNGSPELTVSGGVDYSFPMGANGYDGRFSLSGSYVSELEYRSVALGPVLVGKSDEIFVTRASFSIEGPQGWSATLFIDNLNDEQGVASRTFVGAEDWNARIRPRTFGVQLDYRLR